MGHLSVFQGNERVREKWKRARRMVTRQKKKSRKRSQIERTPAYRLAFKTKNGPICFYRALVFALSQFL